MLLSSTLAQFNANRHAFFLFSEYINIDKNGPLEHIPLHWWDRHLHKMYYSLLYVNFALKLKH